jgi:hypothetical protein
MPKKDEASGCLYILISPNSDCVKIGGTDYPPMKRLKEINSAEPYRSIGPWTLADFRQVSDWRSVESNLHYTFRAHLDKTIERQKELFRVPVHTAIEALDSIDPEKIVNRPKIDRMFQDASFLSYIKRLFVFSGLLNWLDIQGAWTFVLFPATSGGRYFTINIGPHEVAFSTLEKPASPQVNMILLDRLILDFSDAVNWVADHFGRIEIDQYKKALPRATTISFVGSFEEVLEFTRLDGVRRALIAYWNEGKRQNNPTCCVSGA